MLTDEKLIKKCLANDGRAQRELYQRFAPKMWAVCLRFAKDRMTAEDMLQEGFVRVFGKLAQYTFEGSFEGWIRRIMINTAINYYRKNLVNTSLELTFEDVFSREAVREDALDKMSAKELTDLVQELPDGYRLIFNLYAIDGYTHKEIGDIMGISENTSKTQYMRARVSLQEKVRKKLNLKNEGN
jgi:RNA polymerase sigma-70 factor (ECF subfamily)